MNWAPRWFWGIIALVVWLLVCLGACQALIAGVAP